MGVVGRKLNMCTKCEVALHIGCFENYQEQQ